MCFIRNSPYQIYSASQRRLNDSLTSARGHAEFDHAVGRHPDQVKVQDPVHPPAELRRIGTFQASKRDQRRKECGGGENLRKFASAPFRQAKVVGTRGNAEGERILSSVMATGSPVRRRPPNRAACPRKSSSSPETGACSAPPAARSGSPAPRTTEARKNC